MAKGLGRGLGSLIPQSPPKTKTQTKPQPTQEQVGDSVLELPLTKIQPNPDQPRKHFDPHALEELTESIKEHGIIQPLVVSSPDTSGMHSLIAGERRLRAAETLGMKKVPAIVRDVKDHEQLALAIVENVQRSDLNPIEEAKAYERLMDEFNFTQEEVAKKMGKSRSGIANTLRLLELPDKVQDAVAAGKISMGHAKILASLESASEQADYAQKVLNQKMSVRELESATKKVRRIRPSKSQAFDPVREAQEEMLRERLGTKVQIKKSGEKGQINIHFYSLEELQRLLNELT